MGGVLERIRWLQKKSAVALLPSPPIDPMILELQAAKEILASDDPLSHAGRFASLGNTWLNAKRLELEVNEWREIKTWLELVEQVQAFDSPS